MNKIHVLSMVMYNELQRGVMSMLGSRIRKMRQANKMTQQQLADRLGLAKSTISQYENDINEPDADTLRRLSETLGCTADYLLGRTDDPHGFSASSSDEHVSSTERKLLETVRDLPPDKQQQVAEFADFLKHKERGEESATMVSDDSDDLDDVEYEITEIAAHMESGYGDDDPEFLQHLDKVIRRVLRRYDESVRNRQGNDDNNR
ncbi:XRE family transcriptional regulator [Alicyclobacillus macrosporangiidus]|uniref:XRE family transcriptional regulator n=1 Tax=Alicyclobacillus macrosporangiidus TaxID=392015 RepID=UPI00068A7D81|nr:XRE family transcriptional regulator [Alicyclobacillus macrosporangiidus]